ncbi:MAG TPA: hypothetical protein VGC42_23530, partial [Kofleriaceae bacterium]
ASGPIPVSFASGGTGRFPRVDSGRTELSGQSWSGSPDTGVSRGTNSHVGRQTGPIATAHSGSNVTPTPAPGSGVGNGSGVGRSGTEIGVADGASSTFLAAATKALAASVGPMAKVFVKEAVRKICGDRPFSRADGPAVLAHLATTIDDSDDRAMFQRATRAL